MLKYKNLSYILGLPFAFIITEIFDFGVIFQFLGIDASGDIDLFVIEIIAIGILFLLSPYIVYGIIMFIRKQYISNLKRNGKLIQAHYVEVTQKRRITLGGSRYSRPRMQYIIHCEGKNPIDGTLLIFKSEEMSGDPTSYIQESIKSIDVYISNKNPKRYYVDVEQIKKGTRDYYRGMLKGMFK